MVAQIGHDGQFAAIDGGIADAGQALVGVNLDRHEIAARRGHDDLDVCDFHASFPGGWTQPSRRSALAEVMKLALP
jgi:hypothetical protein